VPKTLLFEVKKSLQENFFVFVPKQEGTVYEDPEKEDPTVYVSEKTNRGPLTPDWLEEHWPSAGQNSRDFKPTSGKSIMCAYKLCKVEFRYWGMQSKIER
jgi:hypothetical protein